MYLSLPRSSRRIIRHQMSLFFFLSCACVSPRSLLPALAFTWTCCPRRVCHTHTHTHTLSYILSPPSSWTTLQSRSLDPSYNNFLEMWNPWHGAASKHFDRIKQMGQEDPTHVLVHVICELAVCVTLGCSEQTSTIIFPDVALFRVRSLYLGLSRWINPSCGSALRCVLGDAFERSETSCHVDYRGTDIRLKIVASDSAAP